MWRWIAKKALPVIAANIELDIDTVKKETGTFLRVRVEAMGFKLIDRLIKIGADVDGAIDVNPNG